LQVKQRDAHGHRIDPVVAARGQQGRDDGGHHAAQAPAHEVDVRRAGAEGPGRVLALHAALAVPPLPQVPRRHLDLRRDDMQQDVPLGSEALGCELIEGAR
jgi:hypothetical protein